MTRDIRFPLMHEIVPEGTAGNVQIDHFEMTEEASKVTALRALINRRPYEYCPPGKYARLRIDGRVVMTDTLMELQSNVEVVRRARGRVLIGGLGLGMVPHTLARRNVVESVLVVERNPDVIALVTPTLPAKVRVAEGDVFQWAPLSRARFDTIYFDIWTYVCGDNKKEMRQLRRRYKRFLRPDGWMGCWREDG